MAVSGLFRLTFFLAYWMTRSAAQVMQQTIGQWL